jgi:tyrosyl-DNA phosphodiesterase-1
MCVRAVTGLTIARNQRATAFQQQANITTMEPPNKKIRTDSASPEPESKLESPLSTLHELVTLHRVITPPERPQISEQAAYTCPEAKNESNEPKTSQTSSKAGSIPAKVIDSPIQLTHVRDLPTSKGYNADTVRLRDILGDPMIRECWQFNYLFDVDFLMSQFDEDTRGLVKVRVVHGSWQRENANKIRIEVSQPLFTL